MAENCITNNPKILNMKVLKFLSLKPKKTLFFIVRLSHYCGFKVQHAFPNQSFSRLKSFSIVFPINHFIIRPLPQTARRDSSCVDITYFISVSVAFGRRFNAASKKENETDGMSIHFLIRSFLKTTPSHQLIHKILMK